MIGQVCDAGAQQSYLDLRRTRIGCMQLEFTDNAFSLFYVQHRLLASLSQHFIHD
jgi:hypothetical protein